MSYDKALETLITLNKKYKHTAMNEADTRFQIINKIIDNTLHWPSEYVKNETLNNEGYTDYELTNGHKTFLVIEAKKTKINFNFKQYSLVANRKVKVKLLLKDPNARKTIEQVRNYCNDIGCKYACITNGHEWAFFRPIIEGENWQDGDAFIIYSLENYIENFNSINSFISYRAIVKDFSLTKLFDGIRYSSNERYEPKNKINAYREQINNNYTEVHLRSYFDRYFGEIRTIDIELLKECYVSERGYSINFENMTNIIEDSLSPYMLDKAQIQDIQIESPDKNTFGDKIKEIILTEKKAKVLVLFGGKGAGKTTFLVNLFYNNPTKVLEDHSIMGYVNLLNVANDKDEIKNNILNQLIKKIDEDKILDSGIEDLVNLFHDKYNLALKQSLAGLDPTSTEFIIQRNTLINDLKNDSMYCLSRLATYWREKKKAIIVTIDNTDQFDQSLQDYCFSLAKQVSDSLQCLVIISLREERYVSSKINGYLDAYEQNGFHIRAPKPQTVFFKRLEFIKNKINEDKKIPILEEINILFEILENNLSNEESEFNKFMTAATHGNIRDGIELFKNFLFSNYTNINEMIKNPTWVIGIHQIIKPIMIPVYRFYDEKTSKSLPNLFRLRSDKNSSHFTAYRILNKLSILSDEYTSFHELKDYFIDKFDMESDFTLNINMLLGYGMIEAENGIDKYNDTLQKVKITPYGYYMQELIFKDFSYLELISTDLSLLDLKTFNEVVDYSNDEYKLIKEGHKNKSTQESDKIRYERLQLRIQKVKSLCDYLETQEKLEIQFFHLGTENVITSKILENLEKQLTRIDRSAKKVLNVENKVNNTKNGIPKLVH